MREILFRGKRLEVGQFATEKACEWVYGGYAKDCSGEHIYSSLHSRRMVKVVPDTIGQYTDLTDKNGKKIFEHDICKDSLGTLFTVEWDETNARFLGYTVEHERHIVYVGREPRVEVIGNIHDNPELLNGGGSHHAV